LRYTWVTAFPCATTKELKAGSSVTRHTAVVTEPLHTLARVSVELPS
jgi:hypothetical protein